jgi:hypothetical protein
MRLFGSRSKQKAEDGARPKYKAELTFSSTGATEELDEAFDSREEAQAAAEEWLNNYYTGGEVLRNSNPGDYGGFDDDEDDEDDEDVDLEIFEVDE